MLLAKVTVNRWPCLSLSHTCRWILQMRNCLKSNRWWEKLKPENKLSGLRRKWRGNDLSKLCRTKCKVWAASKWIKRKSWRVLVIWRVVLLLSIRKGKLLWLVNQRVLLIPSSRIGLLNHLVVVQEVKELKKLWFLEKLKKLFCLIVCLKTERFTLILWKKRGLIHKLYMSFSCNIKYVWSNQTFIN